MLAVGFADMVGFTMLSQHLGEASWPQVVSRFEEVAHDTVTGPGRPGGQDDRRRGHVRGPTGPDAARIGLGLAEAYADDDLLSDVRVALAVGPVLVQDGDFYGPVVNLASRLVGIANPGTVLMSDEFHAALEARGARRVRQPGPATPEPQRTSGRVQLWRGPGRHRAGRRPASGGAVGAPGRGPP